MIRIYTSTLSLTRYVTPAQWKVEKVEMLWTVLTIVEVPMPDENGRGIDSALCLKLESISRAVWGMRIKPSI